MSNCVNGKVNHSSTSWDVYITEAERQLSAAKERERGLLEVIARFKMFRDRGERWPLAGSQEPAQQPFAQSSCQGPATATQC
jgi:hypothetical protein